MKRLLFSLLVVTTIFTGCAQSTKRYDVAMKNGLEQIEKENYEEALSEFDKAIAEKSEDSLAKANRMQTFDLIEAKKMIADQKINEANEALDKVINERLGSPKIAEHAREEKEKLTGHTQLYSLSEFKPRYDLDIRKGYLKGRFGAIPFLANLEDLKWQDYDA